MRSEFEYFVSRMKDVLLEVQLNYPRKNFKSDAEHNKTLSLLETSAIYLVDCVGIYKTLTMAQAMEELRKVTITYEEDPPVDLEEK